MRPYLDPVPGTREYWIAASESEFQDALFEFLDLYEEAGVLRVHVSDWHSPAEKETIDKLTGKGWQVKFALESDNKERFQNRDISKEPIYAIKWKYAALIWVSDYAVNVLKLTIPPTPHFADSFVTAFLEFARANWPPRLIVRDYRDRELDAVLPPPSIRDASNVNIMLNHTIGNVQPDAVYNINPYAAVAYQNADAYADIAKRLQDDSSSEASESLPAWFPKTEITRERWKSAYRVMKSLEGTYREKWEQLEIKSAKVTQADYRDALIEELNLDFSTKTIGRIKQAGDNEWLL